MKTRFITKDKVELHYSTKIVKRYENRMKAERLAELQRSYIFQVYKEENNKVTLFGWGIPH